MKEQQQARNPDNHFRTPRRPRTHVPTTGRFRNRSPESASASSRNRTSLPRAQSTLTQIDFVTQSTAPEVEQLDYINERTREPDQPAETSRTDDGSDKDSDYLPAPPVRSARTTKIKPNEQAHGLTERPVKRMSAGLVGDADRGHRPRKSETPRPSGRSKGNRKHLEKSTGKRDKTLTQMDFVRRYITIADDDDGVDMGYIQPTSHKNDIGSEQKKPLPETQEPQNVKRTTPAKRSRRIFEEELDLSTGDPIPQSHATQDREPAAENKGPKMPAQTEPVTPQKSRRREIPSSQTPESPGLTIITSSQFRSATRSPFKRTLPNSSNDHTQGVKQESPEERRVVDDSQSRGHTPSLWRTETESQNKPESLNMPPPNNSEHFSSSQPPRQFDSQELPFGEEDISRDERTKRERTVIYETDADSDYDETEETEETANRSSVTPTPTNADHVVRQASSQVVQNGPESPDDDSPDLPLPDADAPSSLNWDDAPPSEPPMSDASVCYQRMHAATQFPHEPIPTLSTQKMAELFPSEGNTQISKPGSLPTRGHIPGPFSQTQSQSQGDKDPTEMVPESSPVRENDDNEADHATFQRPQAPQSVVQVESSQAVDRDGQWQGNVLSRSQILTSSVMESVPMPNFWMGSQDSVGEPYS